MRVPQDREGPLGLSDPNLMGDQEPLFQMPWETVASALMPSLMLPGCAHPERREATTGPFPTAPLLPAPQRGCSAGRISGRHAAAQPSSQAGLPSSGDAGFHPEACRGRGCSHRGVRAGAKAALWRRLPQPHPLYLSSLQASSKQVYSVPRSGVHGALLCPIGIVPSRWIPVLKLIAPDGIMKQTNYTTWKN